MSNKWSQSYADIVESLNNYNVFIDKFKGDISEFKTAVQDIQLTEEEQKEAEKYKKACEGGRV